jgi:hypothetical protein
METLRILLKAFPLEIDWQDTGALAASGFGHSVCHSPFKIFEE